MTNQELTIRALRIAGRMFELLVVASGLISQWHPVSCLVSWLLVIGAAQVGETFIKLYFKNVKEGKQNENIRINAPRNNKTA